MDLEQTAISRIRFAAEISQNRLQQPLYVAYSGGKDSDICVELARRSGVPFEVHHNHTTADAPETVYHIREVFARLESEGIPCFVHYPYYKGLRTSMWDLIPQKGIPPTRVQRYCCEVLKEGGGKGRMVLTGVRWSESSRRKNNRGIYENYTHRAKNKIILMNDNEENREVLDQCPLKTKLIANPIVDWEDTNIWDYVHSEKIGMNPLYERGFSRVGCIGCPMARKKRWMEFRMYPTFERAYRRAFAKMLVVRLQKRPDAPTKWKTSDDVFEWWMETGKLEGQLAIEDLAAEVK